MASGNYPLDRNSAEGEKLLSAIALIMEVLEETDCDSNQFDNAASDGADRERLRVAIEMINPVLRSAR